MLLMLWIRVESRAANRLLLGLGALYAIAAMTLLLMFTGNTWGAAGLFDRLIQVGLLGCAATGVWLTANALRNLGRPLHFRHRQDASHHPVS